MSEAARGTRTLAAAALRAAVRGEERAAAGLRILDGPLAGCRLPLGAEEILGRGRGASVQLSDPGASRLHLRLRLAERGVRAEDLGSKNGWLLNGRRRQGALLRHGDVIGVGTTRLELELRASPDATPADATPAAASPARAERGWRRLAPAALLALAAAAAALALWGA